MCKRRQIEEGSVRVHIPEVLAVGEGRLRPHCARVPSPLDTVDVLQGRGLHRPGTRGGRA